MWIIRYFSFLLCHVMYIECLRNKICKFWLIYDYQTGEQLKEYREKKKESP
jgi:hypothetical protein